MSNFYTRKRYKQGLAGQKPGIFSDTEGGEAQNRGYERYLENEARADAIAARRTRSRRSSDSYSSSPPKPLTWTQIWVWRAIAAFLVWLDFKIAFYIVTHPNPYPNNPEMPFPWNGVGLYFFGMLFFILPGGFLFWPAVVLWSSMRDDKEYEKK
jgi:hypothetical protein